MPEPQNRAQRRHPDKVDDPAKRPSEPPQSSKHDVAKDGPQDDVSTRAKSSGHKKKTADKWNQ